MENSVLSKKKRAEIAAGIEAYRPMQDRIIKAIRDHGGELSQDDFDQEFCEMNAIAGTIPICFGGRGAFMLSLNGFQQEYLQVTHFMMFLDRIKTKKVKGKVYYMEGDYARKR